MSSVDEVSFQGLTLQEITHMGFPHTISFVVRTYMEYGRRDPQDDKVQWMTDRALFPDEDFHIDIFGVDNDTMMETWSFKDANEAMLFKLTWG